jgi:hypothetical protein
VLGIEPHPVTRAGSSVVEHHPRVVGVLGSTPGRSVLF